MATILGTNGNDVITPDDLTNGIIGGIPSDLADSISGGNGDDLIDGGAVQFFDHGFEWAAAATYRLEGVCDIGVEAYRMTSPAAATGVYEERAGGSVESAEVGEDSRVVHSSVEFRRGSFFVLVTAYETGQAGRDAARELAHIIEASLPPE